MSKMRSARKSQVRVHATPTPFPPMITRPPGSDELRGTAPSQAHLERESSKDGSSDSNDHTDGSTSERGRGSSSGPSRRRCRRRSRSDSSSSRGGSSSGRRASSASDSGGRRASGDGGVTGGGSTSGKLVRGGGLGVGVGDRLSLALDDRLEVQRRVSSSQGWRR